MYATQHKKASLPSLDCYPIGDLHVRSLTPTNSHQVVFAPQCPNVPDVLVKIDLVRPI